MDITLDRISIYTYRKSPIIEQYQLSNFAHKVSYAIDKGLQKLSNNLMGLLQVNPFSKPQSHFSLNLNN